MGHREVVEFGPALMSMERGMIRKVGPFACCMNLEDDAPLLRLEPSDLKASDFLMKFFSHSTEDSTQDLPLNCLALHRPKIRDFETMTRRRMHMSLCLSNSFPRGFSLGAMLIVQIVRAVRKGAHAQMRTPTAQTGRLNFLPCSTLI